MTRRLALVAALIALVLASFAAGPVAAATFDVGQHGHVRIANWPRDGFPVPKAKLVVTVESRLHNLPSPAFASWLSADIVRSNGSQVQAWRKTFTLGPCADCARTDTVTLDLTNYPTGRAEVRWRLNIVDGSKRQFSTSRTQLCIVSCTPSYRSSTIKDGPGTWYTGLDYTVAFIETTDAQHKPGGTIRARIQQGNVICAWANPDFHVGSAGTKLRTSSGVHCGSGTLTWLIPSTLAVGDKLVVGVFEANKSAGLVVQPLTNGSPGAVAPWREYQTWWDPIGFVLP